MSICTEYRFYVVVSEYGATLNPGKKIEIALLHAGWPMAIDVIYITADMHSKGGNGEIHHLVEKTFLDMLLIISSHRHTRYNLVTAEKQPSTLFPINALIHSERCYFP